MRQASTAFCIQFPDRKYRHEKPDIKLLLEKREESYVDVASEPRQHFPKQWSVTRDMVNGDK